MRESILAKEETRLLLDSIIIIGIHEKSCNFNTHYCETTLLAIGRCYSKAGYSHTYYTVKYGDSWWAIAQRNGLNVYTLATQNGKTIYSMIHPGNKLLIK
ncbi:LysM peptidoglycan-binding domain-containing protein [Lactiplantibacillus plantarum]|nr:LysM peptidoglycan-binding domain-containing protein [Lactiplantibacillus plantarum]